jgi:hypothetical protein
MEYLFYFTKSYMHLQDVEKIAAEAGYQCESISDVHSIWLNIYDRGQIIWQWSELHESADDFNGFEPARLDKVYEYQPSAAFAIAHHPDAWPQLVEFLKLILSRYEGWIGCDDYDFGEVFTIENIEDLPRWRIGRWVPDRYGRPVRLVDLDELLNTPNKDLFTPTTYREFLERYNEADREFYSLSYTNSAHRERKEFLSQLLPDMRIEYRARLPLYLLARCPICGGRIAEAIDTHSLNGLGWIPSGNTGFGWYGALGSGQYSRPSYEAECEHVQLMATAVNLNGRQPAEVFPEVWIGPEKPFVMLPLIKTDQTCAVIHTLPLGDYDHVVDRPPYTIYFITYFTGNVTDFNEVIDLFAQERSRVQIGTADYDLIKWVEAGKLFWLDPNDPALPLRNGPVEEFPYGGVEGLEGICAIRDGRLKLVMGPRGQRVRGQPQSGGILRRFVRKSKS